MGRREYCEGYELTTKSHIGGNEEIFQVGSGRQSIHRWSNRGEPAASNAMTSSRASTFAATSTGMEPGPTPARYLPSSFHCHAPSSVTIKSISRSSESMLHTVLRYGS